MGHVDDTQAGLFSLMRNIEDAAAVGTLLDREPLTPVTVAIEIVVANEEHVLLFRCLSGGGRDKYRDCEKYKNDGEKNSTHCKCPPRDESFQMINTPTWSECWQVRSVSSSPCSSQELSSEILPLYLEHIAFTSHHFVQHGIDEESNEQAGDQARDNHNRERLLRVRANASGKRCWQQSQAGNQGSHHNWTQPQQRCFSRGGADVHSLLTELVDVRDQNHRGLHRDAEPRQKPQDRRHAERRMRELQRHQCADWLGHDHAQSDSHGELKVSIQREQNHENQYHRERADDRQLRSGLDQLAVLTTPAQPVVLGQGNSFVDGLLAFFHGALQIASFDAVLHSDVARVVFTINK